MTKYDLIDEITINTGKYKEDVKIIFDCLVETIKKFLLSGYRINIRKFCTFYIKLRHSKIARNISKGIPINVPAHYRPYIRYSKNFIIKIKKQYELNKNKNI